MDHEQPFAIAVPSNVFLLRAVEHGRPVLRRSLVLATLTVLCACTLMLMSTWAQAAAYIRGASAPWGVTTNEAAMDAAFGTGGWDDLRMADGPGPFLPGSGHSFIFLEGGDGTAIELNNYLTTYRTEIEAFVNGGGSLLLNSAPNEGGNIDFGFGGVTLTYPADSDSVVAADAAHPVFSGPSTPVVTAYTGSSFGHAIVSGAGLSPIIIGAPGEPQDGLIVLGELNFGAGLVVFGGMTTDNFHDPQPEAANLRENIIAYAAAGALPPTGPTGPTAIPTLSPWALAVLAGLIGILAAAGLRRRAG